MTVDNAGVAVPRHTKTFLFVLGIALIGANLRAPITSVGPVLPYIQKSLGLSESQAGMLSALPLVIFAFGSLIAPAVGRRCGLERTLAVALLLIFVGTLWRSSTMPAALWCGTSLLSAGIALGNVLLPGLVKRELPDHAALVISIYAAAMAAMAGISAGIAEPMATRSAGGWSTALSCSGLLAILAFFVWLPQLKHTLHHLQRDSQPSMGASAAASPWRSALAWQVSAFFALHSAVFYTIVSWYPSYAMSHGVSLATSGLYLLVYQVVAVASNLLCGPVIRRSRDQVSLGVCCGVLMLLGVFGITVNLAGQIVWIAIAGIAAGLAMTTSLSLFGLRTHDHLAASKLSGMGQFIGYLGAAAGPLLVGLVKNLSGAWQPAFWMLVCISALVTVFAGLAGRDRRI